jgi:hypothetical protein
VDTVGEQLTKIHVWGGAQLTDEFLDGHGRVDGGGLEFLWEWMKKGGGSCSRR